MAKYYYYYYYLSLLLVLGVAILRADALPHDDDTSVSAHAKSTVDVNVHHDGGDDDNHGADGAGGAGNGGDCQCAPSEFSQFMHKFSILLRAYTSDKLVPELKDMVSKLVTYTIDYLAKQKPDQVGHINKLLETSAKATGEALAKHANGGSHNDD